MKFRIAKISDIRRIAAANAAIKEINTVEKECESPSQFDLFWVILWAFLGQFICGFAHRSLMESFVLRDKDSAKETLVKIFTRVATVIRTSTSWSGYQNYLKPAWLVENYHAYDEGATLVVLLERAILSIKRDDEKSLLEVLGALQMLLETNDAHWWDAYGTQWGTEKGATWASYTKEFLENPVKLDAPKFRVISFYSEGLNNWGYIYPQNLYIDMRAFKKLLNGGLMLSEPIKVLGKKLP